MTSSTVPDHPGLADGPVYLDYNATAPVDPRVAAAMAPLLTDFFGNPSSSHPYSAEPKTALAAARAQVADLIGARPDEMVFTASGPEADQLALRGAVLAPRRKGWSTSRSPSPVPPAASPPASSSPPRAIPSWP
ncbi:aminotransferase class V-fold PLP-dependent enzyme [Streptomyces sp. SAS_270]|uniref:aminotransferase class V-fold PLP-dependent enzyme n=1 Tax=Streptomyces sp. SAS_270 TaxID=3412748 RepID=UPI00403C414C